MARFPYRKDKVADLGRLLAQAAVDEQTRSRLQDDPKAALNGILPGVTKDLFSFEVVSEADQKIAVLPYRLNKTKLANQDPEYLASVAATIQ
ncbi:hypothetical protein JM93_00269 [Roseibium hamelinense]|uniref:Uncharacterized protein n=1 Tax=Roseibium hamelinense TaxID=150831 RepID=A0A562TH98_9HYPH|nr:hypothetical protein [Roseibium hamelinense]MTI46084.1 hypothetical protein [Roseibium hamelinense]TWI92723.1 hypothetical protein JM93_00269 [Roseibium hamelinense]